MPPVTNKDKSDTILVEAGLIFGRIQRMLSTANSATKDKVLDVTKLSVIMDKILKLTLEYKGKVGSAVTLLESSHLQPAERAEEVKRVLKVASELYEEVEDMDCVIKTLVPKSASGCGPDPVDSSTMKLPKIKFREFDEDNSNLWFSEMELQFTAHGVDNDVAKFIILSGFLDSAQSLVVAPITCQKPTPANAYVLAKGLLLNAYGLTVFNRLEKALASPPILQEGQRPSQFLACFDMLLGDASIDDLRQWYVRRSLPFDMQLTLANDKSIKCAEDLVKTADSLSLARVDAACQGVSVVDKYQAVRKKKRFVLCKIHEQYGENAFSCQGSNDARCPMEKVIKVPKRISGKETDEH